jgi:hypothetical protein
LFFNLLYLIFNKSINYTIKEGGEQMYGLGYGGLGYGGLGYGGYGVGCGCAAPVAPVTGCCVRVGIIAIAVLILIALGVIF